MILSNIPPEKYFYAHDGSVIKTLQELPEALRRMSVDTFSFHVNEQKNDFYNWTVGVFNNSRLARKIKSTKSKEIMAKKVFTELFT